MPHARAERPTSSFQLCGHQELGERATLPGDAGAAGSGSPGQGAARRSPRRGANTTLRAPVGSLSPQPSRTWPMCPSRGASPFCGGRKRDGEKRAVCPRFWPEGTLGQVWGRLWWSHWGCSWHHPHSAQHGPTESDPPRPPRHWDPGNLEKTWVPSLLTGDTRKSPHGHGGQARVAPSSESPPPLPLRLCG